MRRAGGGVGQEGCPRLGWGKGGGPGPSLLLWIPVLRLPCPQQLTGDRGGPPTVGRGHPGPGDQRPGGHTPSDLCTCQLAEAVSFRTSPGREDPAGVGGPKVMARGGGS